MLVYLFVCFFLEYIEIYVDSKGNVDRMYVKVKLCFILPSVVQLVEIAKSDVHVVVKEYCVLNLSLQRCKRIFITTPPYSSSIRKCN